MNIVSSPYVKTFVPKLPFQLGDIDVSLEFREKHDQWAINRFGKERQFVCNGSTVFVSPATHRYIQTMNDLGAIESIEVSK